MRTTPPSPAMNRLLKQHAAYAPLSRVQTVELARKLQVKTLGVKGTVMDLKREFSSHVTNCSRTSKSSPESRGRWTPPCENDQSPCFYTSPHATR
eukprot:NODE_19241_length_853_cov_2.420110.p1 GENE.NODE_19241_length_853_cov_2.420110~~NODE_19241_length_853_cov_2.420110.p1  ORF type:complete len:95 (+),score=10.78 NODE_19241_length_853_cov_2.420110:42-326(+)